MKQEFSTLSNQLTTKDLLIYTSTKHSQYSQQAAMVWERPQPTCITFSGLRAGSIQYIHQNYIINNIIINIQGANGI